MLRRFRKGSGSLQKDADVIPGLAEEMVEARNGRRHVKVGPAHVHLALARRRAGLARRCVGLTRARGTALSQLLVGSMGLSEWPQGDNAVRTHLFSDMTTVTATDGALLLGCAPFRRPFAASAPARAPRRSRRQHTQKRRLAGGDKVRYELGAATRDRTVSAETVRARWARCCCAQAASARRAALPAA